MYKRPLNDVTFKHGNNTLLSTLLIGYTGDILQTVIAKRQKQAIITKS